VVGVAGGEGQGDGAVAMGGAPDRIDHNGRHIGSEWRR
jgi:hypothetical protein